MTKDWTHYPTMTRPKILWILYRFKGKYILRINKIYVVIFEGCHEFSQTIFTFTRWINFRNFQCQFQNKRVWRWIKFQRSSLTRLNFHLLKKKRWRRIEIICSGDLASGLFIIFDFLTKVNISKIKLLRSRCQKKIRIYLNVKYSIWI